MKNKGIAIAIAVGVGAIAIIFAMRRRSDEDGYWDGNGNEDGNGTGNGNGNGTGNGFDPWIYDKNNDGRIDSDEVLLATYDYNKNIITYDEVMQVVHLWQHNIQR